MTAILDLIGNTPLVQIQNIASHLPDNVRILAKLERFNPGGSVKDRPAMWMIRDGLDKGLLNKDKIILDSTSGNTGIALAMIGSAMGFRVRLVMPGNVSDERKRICRAFGADLIFSDPLEGSDGAILEARRIFEDCPERYFKPDQYNNPANPRAHEESTGPEIWRDTDGKLTHFIASLGTSGTLVGTGRYLKRMNPDIQVIAAEPDSPFHGIEGLKHIDSGIVPGIYDPSVYDELLGISTDAAYDLTQRLAREEGILSGLSCGCALAAALVTGEKLAASGESGNIVIIFPDGGEKYLSTPVFAGSDRVSFGAGI
ncbi:PLP-dependent cysteine synthase family protein [Mariprofundus ferrooxydans]|uniref:Cysteine synthase B n=1 Tax=Mariprofundus ferrooxydans PV-1 TaxID=314345 RepID=Q0EZD8_9PROT|nr:cysteine synthase [Mariprofundus ferrooxydans]EAU54766.1 cysteine synthase, O-acetylserine (thiol) lyase B [Mariprofundus ferrooxydans PV-1]KON46684.1 cysteine synthase [Mariprofundus ferrooxydans]